VHGAARRPVNAGGDAWIGHRNRKANVEQIKGKTSFISTKRKERRPAILAKRPLSFFLEAVSKPQIRFKGKAQADPPSPLDGLWAMAGQVEKAQSATHSGG
jgi:hypothetical protein